MNGTEQKAHTRITDDLGKRLDNVETVLAALDDRVSGVAAATLASAREERAAREQALGRVRDLINEERTHRLKLAEEQRAYVDRGDKPNDVFRTRPFRGRLRWLIRGR